MVAFFESDVSESELVTQFLLLSTKFAGEDQAGKRITLEEDCFYLRSLPYGQRIFSVKIKVAPLLALSSFYMLPMPIAKGHFH